jgi:NAD(P)-dependent dehydrogenase (short-subunit alcohol dehydrogenase family)
MSQNTIALITGGSRGIGKNMALSLAKKGHEVIITFNEKEDDAVAVIREIQAMGQKASCLQLDIADSSGFEEFLSNLQHILKREFKAKTINFLVNNAGFAGYAGFIETTEKQLDDLYNVHFKGPFVLTQKLLPMIENGGGIVNISSGLTRIIYAGSSAYGSMKAAVETLTKYQAKELGGRKIRVNVVAPGAIETDFGGGRVRDNIEVNRSVAAATALNRVGLPGDIGPVVAFLCSEEAGWITGQRIEVSGGQMI